MKRSPIAILIGLAVAVSTVLVAPPASADVVACDSGFTRVLIRLDDGHWRGIACYREATDNWEYQDTYSDGWGVNFQYPQNDMSGTHSHADKNGNNRQWNIRYSEYPEGRTLDVFLCSYDYSESESHGCSGTTVYDA